MAFKCVRGAPDARSGLCPLALIAHDREINAHQVLTDKNGRNLVEDIHYTIFVDKRRRLTIPKHWRKYFLPYISEVQLVHASHNLGSRVIGLASHLYEKNGKTSSGDIFMIIPGVDVLVTIPTQMALI